MGCSRIDYNGETLMDISGDTVTEDTLAQGSTAHNSNGEPIVGKAVFGDGAVTSVNGKTGDVVLSAEDIPHTHSWDKIENKPGSGRDELLIEYSLSEPERDNQGRWCQYFGKSPDVILGETVRVRINFNGTAYERDCKVLSDDGCMYGIPFNNSVYSEETIDDGTYDYDTEPVESGVPSLLLYMVPGASCEVYADKNYTGANIEIVRSTVVKLGNEALYVTDKVTKDSDVLVTSGGVFDALSSAGGGGSSTLAIPCVLDLATMSATGIQIDAQTVIDAFNSDKHIFLKVDASQMGGGTTSYTVASMTQFVYVPGMDKPLLAFDFIMRINGIPNLINAEWWAGSYSAAVTITPLATLT